MARLLLNVGAFCTCASRGGGTLASPLAGERRRGPHKLVTCTLGAYWSIGECIRARHLAEGVGYGSAIVKDLATDVGLAPRTLYEAIQFFDAYDEPPQHSPLTWTHHRLLLRLSSKKDRE